MNRTGVLIARRPDDVMLADFGNSPEASRSRGELTTDTLHRELYGEWREDWHVVFFPPALNMLTVISRLPLQCLHLLRFNGKPKQPGPAVNLSGYRLASWMIIPSPKRTVSSPGY